MSVRVVARIRPLLKLELDKDTIVTAEAAGSEAPGSPTVVRIPNPKNDSESYSFQFNSVYEQESTQQELFDKEVLPTVKHLFNGFDTTIFAYGVTGTGKTHTMRGGKSLADRGVIPRLLSAIYRRCRKIEKDSHGATQVEVAMSYYEIYCDKVFDLFEAPEKRTATGLPIRDNHGKTVVVGLTERPCTTLKEFETMYDQANMNRSTSATKLNAHSSRSHAVLCVKLTQTTGDMVRISRASAIDLAGSEDNRRTENNKERLVESASINKSLFVLAQCVEAISKKQARIPYRESKMTRILSLGQNNGLTIMILNLAPVRSYHLDTLSSLNFANRTKKIDVCEVENEPMFKGPTKGPMTSSIAGSNIQRQPLRPLASAHNANMNANIQRVEKPLKEFSVYSDRNKQTRPSNISHNTVRRANETQKRSAESAINSRPTKITRPSAPRHPQASSALSAAAIEAIIDAKLSEKLAERALNDATPAVSALPPDLQKRLDELEARVEASEDKSREEGLHYLLMAKQHQARGEDNSALKMLQLAAPYFPSNEKLERKIATLKEKVHGKKAPPPAFDLAAPASSEYYTAPQQPSEVSSIQEPARRPSSKPKPRKVVEESVDDDGSAFIPEDAPADAPSDDEYASSSSFTFKRKKPAGYSKAKRNTLVFRDLSAPNTSSDQLAHTPPRPNSSTLALDSATSASPRTQELLRIINTKDATQIRGLRGVGAKRAEAIVNCLMDLEEVRDLADLAGMKGVGQKGVENMRMGLGEVLVDF